MPSPFSPLCEYKVTSYPYIPRAPGHLSGRDEAILSAVSTFGAAAFFQLQQLFPGVNRNKVRRTAKTLARCGLLALHRLECEEYRINVCTPSYFPGLDSVLRSMAFFQLYLRLKEMDPNVRACPAPPPLTGAVLMNNKEFPVVVARRGDVLNLLPFYVQTKKLKRLVIVAEVYDPVFRKIPCPCRVAFDDDLLDLGKPLEAIFFDAKEEGIAARAAP